MNTIRWNVAVSADTDQSLRMFLASQGGGRKGDLSRFIEEAVRAHILELSAEQAKAADAGDWEKAESLFLKAISLRPNFFPSYGALSELYDKKGDTKKAEEYRAKAKELSQ